MALSAALRDLIAELGVATCTEVNARAGGIPGLTDPNGYLSGDPARILAEGWLYATTLAVHGLEIALELAE